MQKAICALTGKEFLILDQENIFFEKNNLPLPTICGEERVRQVMSARNERILYRRKCDSTGKDIISAYIPKAPFPVYKNDIWWGDTWNASEYGKVFDFSRPFFDQFAELQKVVPREGTSIFNCENCDYNSHARESKNCYMNSLMVNGEDVHYCYWVLNDKDIMDCMYTHDSTLCYECSEVRNGYNCILLQEAINCSDCYFSYQMRGCDHCIFCSNLTNKSYYAFNKKCSKEKFEKIKSEFINGSFVSFKEAKQKFIELRAKTIHRAVHNINCENVTGDHLYTSRNCINFFDGLDCEDVYNSVSLGGSKNVYGGYGIGWPDSEVIYLTCIARGCQRIFASMYVWFSSDLYYSDSCVSCHDCFGCIGLKHKEYSILNKQYTKEEYEKILPKIVEHMKKTKEWGFFFPSSCVPFAYNETAAQDQMPITKETALKLGYRWRDEGSKEHTPQAHSLPDNVSDVSDTICEAILTCEETGKNYKIIEPELKFYRKMNLPIPRFHPNIRHKHRMDFRNPRILWTRNCDKCREEILTTYSPERPETVYCEKCYLEMVE